MSPPTLTYLLLPLVIHAAAFPQPQIETSNELTTPSDLLDVPYPPGYGPTTCSPPSKAHEWDNTKFCPSNKESQCTQPFGDSLDTSPSQLPKLTASAVPPNPIITSRTDVSPCVPVGWIRLRDVKEGFIVTPIRTMFGGIEYYYSWESTGNMETYLYYKQAGRQHQSFKRRRLGDSELTKKGNERLFSETSMVYYIHISLQPREAGHWGVLAMFQVPRE